MPRESWELCILLLTVFSANVLGSFVGINIGTDISNLPSISTIISILNAQNIKHVRLLNTDHKMLTALANTGIEVMVSVPNDQISNLGKSNTKAADWINKNILSYLPATNITYIAVGNKVLTENPNGALFLVRAIRNLHSALVAANLDSQVKISSPQSMEVIPKPFPPSAATFNSSWNSVMNQFLQFLENTESCFMLNAQPYYGYSQGGGIFPIEYALFRSLTPDKQIVDPNTLFSYSNMFDAMVDAAYYSMQALNFSGIDVMVTESGWPSLGGVNEPDATVDNALVYNSNLVRHVLNGSGTPSQPNLPIDTYIYELFNEDLRPGPVSERNWGMYYSNGSVVYTLDFGDGNGSNDTVPSGLAGVFCVANSSADTTALKKSLDWACGPGSANCSAIQPGQPCYVSDDLVATASFAFNDYYHRTEENGGTCNFGNTAMITSVDPSHDSCIFAGSSGSNGSSTNTSGPTNDASTLQHMKWSYVHMVPAFLFLFAF